MAIASELVYDDKNSKLTLIGITGTKGKTTAVSFLHNILDYEMEANRDEENLWKDFEGHKRDIEARDRNHPDVYTELEKNSCKLYLRTSQLLSRNYYAEYALMFFLQYYIPQKLRKLGRIYSGGFFYKYPVDFVLAAHATDKPGKTIQFIKDCFKEIADYNFTEKDLLSIRYIIFSFLFSALFSFLSLIIKPPLFILNFSLHSLYKTIT